MALYGMKGPSETVGEIIIQHGLNRKEGMGAEAGAEGLPCLIHNITAFNPYLIRLSFGAPSSFVYPRLVVLWEMEGGRGTGKIW